MNENNLIPGGKSLSGGQTHSPVLTLRVSTDLKARIDADAKSRGMGTSKRVREILEKHYADD